MRRIQIKTPGNVAPCPKCGNLTEFEAHSLQVSEDCCEVWINCQYGYDPPTCNTTLRFEDVWGGTSDGNVLMALTCWTDAIMVGGA